MADVHVHNDGMGDADHVVDTGIAMIVFTVIAILAVAAFAYLAFNGTFFQQNAAPAGTDINVTIPDVTPSTNQGGVTTPQE